MTTTRDPDSAFGSVSCVVWMACSERNVIKYAGPRRESFDPGGNHDPPRGQPLAVGELQSEP